MQFEPYPFEKLSKLLEPLHPADLPPLTLTIGEPQFETPSFIQKALINASELLKKYPKTGGEAYLNDAIRQFVIRRYGVALEETQLVSTFGTREVLFNLPQYLLHGKTRPVMAFTHPFYQIYEGAAIAAGAEVRYLHLDAERNFTPAIDEAVLAECDLVILNFPNNPTGACLDKTTLMRWNDLALTHDFILINDECYSEIYTDTPPTGLLEAAALAGNTTFRNILAINSISKRSSAPGLRSGFVAGDATLLDGYRRYRTYIGCASPLPLQRAAAVAWSDEEHVEGFRALYRRNFELAASILGITPPEATFYLWLEVGDAIAFTTRLYEQYNVTVLPGEFLARTDASGHNPGKGFVRIALVQPPEQTEAALLRIREALDGNA